MNLQALLDLFLDVGWGTPDLVLENRLFVVVHQHLQYLGAGSFLHP
jgi:hypothetical protein